MQNKPYKFKRSTLKFGVGLLCFMAFVLLFTLGLNLFIWYKGEPMTATVQAVYSKTSSDYVIDVILPVHLQNGENGTQVKTSKPLTVGQKIDIRIDQRTGSAKASLFDPDTSRALSYVIAIPIIGIALFLGFRYAKKKKYIDY
jgi:hypothetical protein